MDLRAILSRCFGQNCVNYLSDKIQKVSSQLLPKYECPTCYDEFNMRDIIKNTCKHIICRECFKANLRANKSDIVNRMKFARAQNIRCFMYECEQMIAPEIIQDLPDEEGIVEIKQMIEQISQREFHINNKPEEMTFIECKHMSCVGICYNKSIWPKCRICRQRTYNKDQSVFSQIFTRIKKFILPVTALDGVEGWRACPHCGMAIIKNGGCNNMRCTFCYKTFLWGDQENSIAGVNEAHAPRLELRN